MTPDAVKYLMAIAENASKKLKYKDPQDREDCIMFAMEDVVKYWRGFDPEKSNYPFAYYTQVAKVGFAQGWNQLHPKMFAGGKCVSLDRTGPNGESNSDII